MNSHGIAQFKLASRLSARRIIEGYAFPDKDRPKITTPSPAKGLVYEYQRAERSSEVLARAIAAAGEPNPDGSSYERGRRTSILRAAKHLKGFGDSFAFENVRKRHFHTMISGLRVSVSLDFLATLETKSGRQTLGIIYNVATGISENPDKLKVHAQIESEIALRVVREQVPSLDAIWFLDLLGEKVVKKKATPTAAVWKEIEIVCDDIVIAHKIIVARESRIERRAT